MFHFMSPLISLPAFIDRAFCGKTFASFFFFLIIICFVSFHLSFSETAILRNILFMCTGGWIYSVNRRTIKAKMKSERDDQSH